MLPEQVELIAWENVDCSFKHDCCSKVQNLRLESRGDCVYSHAVLVYTLQAVSLLFFFSP